MIWTSVAIAGSVGAVEGAHRGWVERVSAGVDRLLSPGLGSDGRTGQGTGLTDEATRDADPVPPQDLESFGRAFATHEADVARVCRRLLGGSEEAQDAPHEVFLRASRSLHTYDRSRPLRPWLLTIAGNYCIDRLRHQATEQRVFVDLDPEQAEAESEPGPSPLGRLVAREEREAVGRAIAGLPLKYRVPLALRYFSDLDYEAIGQAVGVSRSQVGTLLFRAKRMLREAMQASSSTAGTRRAGEKT